MERENHVVRIPHPDDGRARLVQVTSTGRAYWDSLQNTITAFYEQGMKGVSFDDGASLLHLLAKLQKSLGEISLGGDVSAEQDDS
ncbi:hypothetical protein D9M71_631780 [compost metagenome]